MNNYVKQSLVSQGLHLINFFLKFVSLPWDISRLNDNALLIEEFKASCVIIVVSTFAVGQSSVIGLFSL